MTFVSNLREILNCFVAKIFISIEQSASVAEEDSTALQLLFKYCGITLRILLLKY